MLNPQEVSAINLASSGECRTEPRHSGSLGVSQSEEAKGRRKRVSLAATRLQIRIRGGRSTDA